MKFRQLTYCLVTLLVAASTAFGQKLSIVEPKPNTVSMLTRQAVIINGTSGRKVRLFANGVAVDSGAVRVDGVCDFLGVPVPTGDVVFKVSYIDNATELDSVRIHIAGQPTSIEICTSSNDFLADGKSITRFELVVRDTFGVAIPSSYIISVKSDTGTIVSPDVDPNQEGVQRSIENGKVLVDVQAPAQAAVVKITATWGNAKSEKDVEYNTPIEPLMLVGSANGTLNTNSVKTSNNFSDSSFALLKDANTMSSGVHTDGRLAFYGRGSIWSNYLLTASYDNQRMQRDQFFKDLDPDVLYSVYGDNSNVDYTAQTSSPLFIKLERNRSHILFGDFNTAFAQNELARYDRTFTGIKSHYETNHDRADAFATVTDRKVVQKEIRGEGISGFYFLGNSNVVTGSEKVRIEVRDKLHTEVVLNRLEKSRINDYEIDYQQGTLFFKQPVPSIDNSGNPVTIVVTYESQSGFPTNYVAGVQGEKELVNGLVVGATAVTEERDPNNYTLLGLNSRYSLGTSVKALGEIAQGQVGTKRGAAWKVEVGGSPVAQLDLKSYYRKVEAGFVNPTVGNGGLSDGLGGMSTERYGIGGTYEGIASTKLGTDYYHTLQNSGTGTVKTNSVSGSIERSFANFLNTSLRVENARYESSVGDSVPSDKRQSTIINGKATVKASSRINVTGEYERSISSSDKEAITPSVGTLGVDYRIIDPVTLTLQQKFYTGKGTSSIFGLSSAVGFGTSITGKYEIGNGISGKRNQASIGLKNTTKITDDLTSELLYEKTRDLNRNVLETSTPDHDAYSIGLEYLPKNSYKATIKAELGKDAQSMRRNLVFGGDLRIARDFTLIEKLSYYEETRSQSQNPATGFVGGTLSANPVDQVGAQLSGGMLKKFHNVVGLAYRPVSWDWLNAIGKFEQKSEYNGMVAPEVQYNASIISLHTFIEPIRRLEFGIKYAMKLANERAYGLSAKTFTDLYLVRGEYDLNWNNFDVAAEYRILTQREANDQKIGYSAEVGYVAMQNVHIGVGYNFIGNKDRDLIDYNYWSKGPYVTMRIKFTEKILNYFQ
jgi:hypothetical protein